MDDDFDVASAVSAAGDGRWQARIPMGWRQGAGVYGGLGCAILLRAMSAAVGGRPPRTLTAQFAAPIPEGDTPVEVTVERRGTTMAFVSARLRAEGRVALHGVATFGTDRSPRLDEPAAQLPDDVPDAAACTSSQTPSPPFPQFLRQYDVRLAVGALPTGGPAEERIGAWIRPKRPVALGPELAVALLDAMPPVALTRAPGPGGMASVALHTQLLAPLPDPDADPEAHAYVEVRSAATRGGFSDQSARLYGPDRRLIAVVSQLFAVLG